MRSAKGNQEMVNYKHTINNATQCLELTNILLINNAWMHTYW